MKARLSIILFSALFFFCSHAFSQQAGITIDTLISKYNRVSDARPIEKIYLHFDRPYYALGDTIWFKGYLTIGLHQLSGLSRVMYVDIINSRDSLVKTMVLPVTNGTSIGSIPLLSPLYKQDNYHIKAYTKWMMNFEQTYFFHKTITIGDAKEKDFSTIVSFNRSQSNNVPKINAEILYKDASGTPLSNKKVTWDVTKGFEDIASGKGSTDQKGLLSISFLNTKGSDLSSAILTVAMDAGKGKSYEKIFPMKTVAAPADVQFLAEGGNLINDVPTKIAVKAVQSNGSGIDFNAAITDNTGNTVTTFNSQHAGMGAFVITPQAGKTYKANIDFKDGTKGSYDLPAVKPGGITISVSYADTSKIAVRVMADSSYLKSHLRNTFYLVGKSGQVIFVNAAITLSKVLTPVPIPSSLAPTGIAQLTLMTSSGEPLSERVVFITHKDQLNVSVNTDKKTYGPRQKIMLDVVSKNSTAPAEADLSISVIDESKLPVDENAETTILSSLLLTSDLQGYIENPNYYFNNVTDKTRSDLDILMLTQGYRRFLYQDVLANKISAITYFPEIGLALSGTLRSINGMPYKGGRVTLQIPDRYYTSKPAISDADGKFNFSGLIFTDTAKIIVHAKDNVNAKNLMVTVDGAAYPVLGKNPDFADEKLNIDTMMITYLQNLKKVSENSRVLKEVVVTTKSVVKVPGFQDYSALAGLSVINDQMIPADRIKDCTNLLNCLPTYASGITYDPAENNFYVSRDYNAGNRTPMAVFVGGMFTEVTHLNNINVPDILSVEVFLKDDLGLVNNANRTNGVIVVNLKPTAAVPKGGSSINYQQLLKDFVPQPNVVKMTPNGYSIARQFYSPKYLTANAFASDHRTTIYWNPRLLTDAAGKASAEFYSADSKGTYRAVVEGLDKDGHIAYSVYRFKVE